MKLTNDLRFDVTAVPVNRTLAKVNLGLSSGRSNKWGYGICICKHFHVRNRKHIKHRKTCKVNSA